MRAVGRGFRPDDWIPVGLVVLTLYAGVVGLPAAHTAREARRTAGVDPAAVTGFARLHRLSGILNAIVMLSGVVALIMEALKSR